MKTNCHIHHTLIKYFDLRLYIVIIHLLCKIHNHIFSVNKNLVTAEIAGSAVKCCHLRVKINRCKSLLIAHTYRTACRRLYNNIRQLFSYSINTFFESVRTLCRCSVIFSYMKMYDSGTRIISGFCFSYDFFHRVRYIRILLLCNLGAAYTCCNNKFFHICLLVSLSVFKYYASSACSAYHYRLC